MSVDTKMTDALPEDQWLPEFQKVLVDGIDTSLIKSIAATLRTDPSSNSRCSPHRVMEICQDDGQWIYPDLKTGKRKKTHYWRLRRVADFLAVPPWFLLETEYNQKLRTLFEQRSTAFSTYPVRAIESINGIPAIKAVEDKFTAFNLERRFTELTQEDIEKFTKDMTRAFLDLRSQLLRGETRDRSDSFYTLLRRISSFEGPYSFSVWTTIPTSTSRDIPVQVRLVQGQFSEPTIKRYWQAGWFSVSLEDGTMDVYKGEIKPFADLIAKSLGLSVFVGLEQPEAQQCHMVYSWHSLRDKDLQEEFEEQCEARLVEKMPQVPLTMNFQAFISMMNTHQYVDALVSRSDDIVELIKWVSFDIPRTRRPSARRINAMFGKHRRRQNSLNLLFDRGYLRDGDTLEFIVPPFTSPMSSDATDLKNLTCTVESENGKPYVAWNSENYSITGLTRIILESRRMKVDTEHLNGNTYWRKQGDNQTLFDKAEELAREI